MAERIAKNDSKELWREIMKVKQSKHVAPGSLDGISEPQDVANARGNTYEELFNSVPSDSSCLQDLKDKVKVGNCATQYSDYSVSESEMGQAINKLREGKSDGETGFTSK